MDLLNKLQVCILCYAPLLTISEKICKFNLSLNRWPTKKKIQPKIFNAVACQQSVLRSASKQTLHSYYTFTLCTSCKNACYTLQNWYATVQR
jgi:hypothetical protein